MLNRRHRLFRPASWLAAVAILLQTLVPAVHHGGGMARAATPAFGDAKTMCLAPGSTAPDEPKQTPGHTTADCTMCCQALHAFGGFVPPSSPALIVRQDEIAAFMAPAPEPAPRLHARIGQQPRAPPARA
jgi:hypothetical protein